MPGGAVGGGGRILVRIRVVNVPAGRIPIGPGGGMGNPGLPPQVIQQLIARQQVQQIVRQQQMQQLLVQQQMQQLWLEQQRQRQLLQEQERRDPLAQDGPRGQVQMPPGFGQVQKPPVPPKPAQAAKPAPKETKQASVSPEQRANAKLKLAKTLLNEGHEEDAREYLRDVVANYPETIAAYEAGKLLERLQGRAAAVQRAGGD